MIYVLLLTRVHRSWFPPPRLMGNAFGVKLLHLFTIPFGVYEKDRQTQTDVSPRCHGMAGASTQRFISHLEAK